VPPSTLELSELDLQLGRLFMTGLKGPELDPDTEALIRDFSLGGIVLFSRNIQNPVQLASLCNDLQEKAIDYHQIPLFLAVDQEGGPVARLKEPFTLFPGSRAIGEDAHPVDRAVDFARVTAREMALVGLNMDLAPVVDVPQGVPEKHLEGRTFGEDPKKVGLLGRTVVRELQKNGIMAVAKHFPGLGRAGVDPHHHLPRIDMAARDMERINLPPFKEALSEGVCAVMTSHALYPALEPERPATLSQRILSGLLREKLGFDGLIITDDLEMGAIARTWGTVRAAAMAFKAGADILLICQDQGLVLEAIRSLRKEVLQGQIPYKRLRESLDRIEKAKARFLNPCPEISLDRVRDYFGLS